MKARLLATLLSATFVAHAVPSFADPPADDPPEAPPPRVALVDYESIPTGTLPSFPTESSVPAAAPSGSVSDLEVDAVTDGPRKPFPKRMHRKKSKRPSKGTKVVEIKPVTPVLGLLYTPTNDSTDFGGDTTQRMACDRDQGSVSAVRWEKLRVGKGDEARLEVSDLWFDGKSCRLGFGSTTVVPLKAIAWDDGKAWLFAVRSENSVTFVLPSATEASADTMAGAALTIRGGFTRVTLPLGRWGAGSVLAQLPSLAFEPSPATSKSDGTSEGTRQHGPFEVAVELVQTMSERHPTLVVRTQSPEAALSLRSFE